MAAPRSFGTGKPYTGPKTFALADLIGKAMDPVLARQGFGASDIVLHWEEIVGERLARVCEPIKLQWPARPAQSPPDRRPEPASLLVRVESGFAIELQHLSALVIERVNMHLGWRCVGRILLRQGPVGTKPPRVPRRSPEDPLARAEAARQTAGVEDEALRAALTRLGTRVMSEKPSRTQE
jgi:hypothetical protein